MASLPMCMAVKSTTNSKYLRYVHEDVQLHGYLQFTGDEAVSPYTKNELVPANDEANKGLVHIRSSYNNKYWTRVSGNPNVWWIAASADEPVEDRSEWSCTLFEPSLLGADLRLRHVQLNQYLSIFTGTATGAGYESCLIARTAAAQQDMVFTIFDWGGSALVLPKKVVFSGGQSDRYINLEDNTTNQLAFDTRNFRLPTVSNEVFYTRDGKVRIRSDYNRMFWRRQPTSWISANSTTDNNEEDDPETLFSLVKAEEGGDNVVALLNLGNSCFARRYTAFGRISGVHATTSFGTMWSDWKVEEPVEVRSIYDVVFRLKDARIYDQDVVTMASLQASNPLACEDVINVAETFTKQRTSTWKSIVSIKSLCLGVTTPAIKTGIPLIGQGVVEVSPHLQFEGPYDWGHDLTESVTIEWSEDIKVPPQTTLMVHVMANTGKCDVPFSYTQQDTLFNGEQVTYQMNDGIYTCANYYNFHAKVSVMGNPWLTT